jgi:hypothetical protein
MASPFFGGEDNKNWLLGIAAAKMVTNGVAGNAPSEGLKLSKE